MSTLDRDKVREVLWPLWDSAQMDDGEIGAFLDALETCVVDTPQTDPRVDALSDLLDRAEAHYQASWSFDYPVVNLEEARAILRGEMLPLPASGVVLTPEEADWFRDLLAAEMAEFGANQDYNIDGANELMKRLEAIR